MAIRKRVKCKFCDNEYAPTGIKSHEKACKSNPANSGETLDAIEDLADIDFDIIDEPSELVEPPSELVEPPSELVVASNGRLVRCLVNKQLFYMTTLYDLILGEVIGVPSAFAKILITKGMAVDE